MLINFQFQKATFYLQSGIYCTYLPELLLRLLFLVCNVSSRELKFQPPWHLGLQTPWWQKMKKNRGKGIIKSIESKLTTFKLLTVQLPFYRLQAIMTSVLKLWLLLPFFAPLDFSCHRSHSKGLGFYHHLVAFSSLTEEGFWSEIHYELSIILKGENGPDMLLSFVFFVVPSTLTISSSYNSTSKEEKILLFKWEAYYLYKCFFSYSALLGFFQK